MAEAKSWDEGGSNRTYLHIAGGGPIDGLGGGRIGAEAAGVASGGVASAIAGKLNGLANDIGGAKVPSGAQAATVPSSALVR